MEEPNFDDNTSIDDGSDTSSVIGGSDIGEVEGGAVDIEFDEDEESEEDDDENDDDDDDDDEIEGEGEENDVGVENISSSSSDEEDDDDDEDDENYLQKMDDHVRSKVIENHHPELKTLNYEEVEALATVIKDANGVIIDPLHQTLPILSRYEKARALGERARQINGGAKPMIEVDPTILDGYLIALKELEQKRLPFIIQRPLPNGGSEYWRIADLEIL
jgi:DNA-directed RNA polymerase I, II, and III subunit RPABC2